MAFCGQCGQKNPDGAAFCSACGAKLRVVETPVAENAPRENNQPRESVKPRETPHQRERVILHKEGTPPPRHEQPRPPRYGQPQQPRHEQMRPPRYEQPQQPRYEQPQQPRYEQTRPPQQPRYEQQPLHSSNRGFEKPAKKGGTMGGCLKKLLLWIIGIIVVIGGILYAIGSWFGDTDGGDGGEENDNQKPSQFERVMDRQQVEALVEAQGFPTTTKDVAPLGGEYVGSVKGWTITVTLKPEQNGKIVGRVKQDANGYTAVSDGVYCYCGNSIYAVYKDESYMEEGKVQNYFYAQPDRKSIMMIDGDTCILKRKEVIRGEKAKSGLLNKDYERSFDDEDLVRLCTQNGIPTTPRDVSLQPGTYKGSMDLNGVTGNITFKVEDVSGENKKIVGKVEMIGEAMGQTASQDLILTYAGHSVYVAFLTENKIGRMSDAMPLYVNPDGKTLNLYDKNELAVTLTKE